MYDQFTDLWTLASNDPLFEFLYLEAARDAASIFMFRFKIDDHALMMAREYFKQQIHEHRMILAELPSWDRRTSVVINILVRATSAFPIIQYQGPVVHERTNKYGAPNLTVAYNPDLVKEQTNSLIPFVFAATILSMEMSRYLRRQGYVEANVAALSAIPKNKLRYYISIIEASRSGTTGAKKIIRRDLRVTWFIKYLLKKDLLTRLHL